jgi:Transglycosylase SLT domain
MTRFTKLACAVAMIGLSACVPAKLPPLPSLPSLASVLPQPTPPVMRWDHRPEAAEWTTRSLAAIARHDDVLASRVPADIQAWCPGYDKNEPKDRRAFWAGLLSAVAKYESTWNPAASGGGGRYIGLMQISPKTAKN